MLGCLLDTVIAVVVLILKQTVTNKQTNKRLAVASNCSAGQRLSQQREGKRGIGLSVGWLVAWLIALYCSCCVSLILKQIVKKHSNKRLCVASNCSAGSEGIWAKGRNERHRFVGWMVGCLVGIVIAVVVVVVLTLTQTNKQTNKQAISRCFQLQRGSKGICAKGREERQRFVGWMVGCLVDIVIAVVVSLMLKQIVKNIQTSD